QRGEAEQARNKAVAAKKPADELIKILRYDLREALEKVDLARGRWRVNGNAARCVPGRRAALEASLAIREKLAKQDPGNAGWQADLAFSYWRTGTTLARSDPQSKKDARTMVENGRDVLRELKTRTGLMPLQQLWLEAIEADLRKMHE